ncbi:glycosyltransferase [[Brevibacterium] frigoritolerans]|nr:glycosyltransferase [Peribacillus frigoritolerans]
MQTKLNITVITVTYGDRWSYLKENLLRLDAIDLIKNIIVINNGSKYDIKENLEKFPKCSLVDIPDNSGSAKGFSLGIRTFLDMQKNILSHNLGEWVLFLDDDNYIKEINKEELENLLMMKHEQQAYICKRLSRSEYYINYQPIKYNSFLGFNCFKSKPINTLKTVELLPYSGLLLRKDIIEKIGLPNEDFYLYCDDYDYTFRLVKNNIVTNMIDCCIIDDIEISWNKENENFAISVVQGTPLKVYYSVRNRVYFEKNNGISNNFLFLINGFLFLMYVIYKNMKNGTRVNFKSLHALTLGIFDGLRGKLGIHKNYNLQ